MPSEIYANANTAADFIRSRLPGDPSIEPKIAVVLGSGLGAFAHTVKGAVALDYAEIPHFTAPTVLGHNGRLVIGTLRETPVVVMQGRVHYYEGFQASATTFPLRVLKQLGITTLIVTNACGGIRDGLKQGDLVLISDHINLTGTNPLIGVNEPRFGNRFFDMTTAYSPHLRALAQEIAGESGFTMPECVYLAVSGPSFETPAEIRAFRALGADLVGMSTVHEVIVARHMDMEVLGISCVTNLAAGIQGKPLDHHEVLETGLYVQQMVAGLLTEVIAAIAAGD